MDPLTLRFENKKYLYTATSPFLQTPFERLEFLGDALFEMIIIGGVSSYFEKYHRGTITPNFLQQVKVHFLSNNAMFKFFLFFHLDKFIQIDFSRKQREKDPRFFFNIKSYSNALKSAQVLMKSVKTFAEFFEMVLPALKQPADIWEALAAAVLLDGGIEAVRRVYLRLLAPFLIYFVFQLAPALKFYE